MHEMIYAIDPEQTSDVLVFVIGTDHDGAVHGESIQVNKYAG